MNCPECQEQIARAAKAGAAPEAVFDHLARCPRCRRFAAETVEVTAALASWDAPEPDGVLAKDALICRLADTQERLAARGAGRPAIHRRFHPAALAAPAAAAILAGAGMAPGWVRQLAAGWIILAAVLVAMVLMQSGCGTTLEGEMR